MRGLLALVPLLALATAAPAAAPRLADPAATREALAQALKAGRAAELRSWRLEREAAAAGSAAEKAAREAAAIAARIQQAEAGMAAAEAQGAIAARELAALREELGRRQQPIVRLTAALQQFSRRPVALSVLRSGSVEDVVYLRAVMASAVPEVRGRTAGLRAALARSRALQAEADRAREALLAERQRLADERAALAALEARQRLASRTARGEAAREAERALALGEQARDLDELVGELERAASLRQRLAALPGPLMRPEGPGQAAEPAPAAAGSFAGPSQTPPRPYMLPVAGRTVAGFGAQSGTGRSQGITLAPRPGAQVVAPAQGRVAFAGPYRGYGRIVILEHPGGWTSLVTGLASTAVTTGEEIIAGSPLGQAGSDAPSITLELRREGQPVNPLPFVG